MVALGVKPSSSIFLYTFIVSRGWWHMLLQIMSVLYVLSTGSTP